MKEKAARFRQSMHNPQVLRHKSLSTLLWIMRWAFIAGLCYLFLFPLLFMIATSLQEPTSVNDPSIIWIPKSLSLASIAKTIEVMNYWRSAGLTLLVTVGSTLGSLLSCSLVGYGFARFKFFGKNVFFALVVLTILVPPQTILPSTLMNFQFFDFFGLTRLLHMAIPAVPPYLNLINNPVTFILPSLFASGLRAGLFIFIFRQFFLGMSQSLEEAARIDGCGALQTYVRIILPVAVPAFITVTLFSFIWHWNDYYSATMYFTGDVRMIMPVLQSLQRQVTLALGVSGYEARIYMAAGPLLTILPPLILYIFTQRYFTESIERTGIVG